MPDIPACAESIGLDGICIPGISCILIESTLGGAGCIFISPIGIAIGCDFGTPAFVFLVVPADVDFLTVVAVRLRVPDFVALAVVADVFFFLIFLPIGMFMGICVVPFL